MDETTDELTKIVEEIEKDYQQLNSFEVYENQNNGITLKCIQYSGKHCITAPQFDYIKKLCDYKSNNNLRKMNKWCASAVISTAKKYPNIRFYVYCGY